MPLTGSGQTPAAQPLPVAFPVPDPAPPAARRRSSRGRRATASASAGEPEAEPLAGDDAPAPVPAEPANTDRQLVFFGAETGEPSVADLAGLLAGPGEVHRMGGTARLSVVVDAAWRVHVLVGELAQRGVRASWAATEDQRYAVRTAYTRAIVPLAAAWLRGPTQHPPPGFQLDGRRLRLWLAAAGIAEPPDFLLRLGGVDAQRWSVVGAALARAGLAGELVEPGPGGPGYLIRGRRRTLRLAELVGERPSAAPSTAWPTRG
ncbi:hypothetical protein SAMN05443287_106171 [Micromonospora phaseoli]|uniref:Uncharacterized protein n=1 Tax=Micromonospora phaseoli TaxID=1144548 RepID=A0A1H7AIY3_9ACTN|nr:hypothetical protein [Micromonospora phaseoli]PZV96339.1 hypothetical protein CLV64_107217 [Micromonospora phaseoli]GIJ76026.1 hypothetical protein Xph01_04580 [Micromonospora phaseoli]SEJ65601.1 hypothetical protein SAMN05443287_106171 [Micromonospora phaseoli]